MSLVCFVNPLIPICLQPCHMPRSQWLGETVRWAETEVLRFEKYDWYTWQTPSGHGYKKIYLHFSIAPCYDKIKHSVLIFTVCTKKVYGFPLFPLKIRPDRKKWGKIKKRCGSFVAESCRLVWDSRRKAGYLLPEPQCRTAHGQSKHWRDSPVTEKHIIAEMWQSGCRLCTKKEWYHGEIIFFVSFSSRIAAGERDFFCIPIRPSHEKQNKNQLWFLGERNEYHDEKCKQIYPTVFSGKPSADAVGNQELSG